MCAEGAGRKSATAQPEIDAAYSDRAEALETRIQIVDYDPEWPNQFSVVASRVRSALGSAVLSLEHVGSTAVPGLAAKPIIDVHLVVADSAREQEYLPQLRAAGYELAVREPDWFEHRMLKGSEPAANLHVFSAQCPELERVRTLRDWLRGNADDRRLYERVKRSLAERDWTHVQHYADAKTTVIEEIMSRATR